jgi:hypothetical protein
MGPALSDAELALLYPNLSVQQRREKERLHRARAHAVMQGQQPPGPPEPPYPEAT